MKLFLVVVISYLIGSIPVGHIVGRLRGIDIRQHGSGNIGATNVWRTLGAGAGLLVLIGDAAKGAVAVLLGRYFVGGNAELLTALFALIGHSWPVFLGFQGGKIIATSLGVFILLDPLILLPGLGIWIAVVGLSRYVSLGSILATGSLPIWMLVFGRPWTHTVFGLLVAGIAIYKHLPNIKRLLSGTESRIGK